MLITANQLQLVVPTLQPARSAALASSMNLVLPGYGINTADILHEFVANAAHESGGFRLKEENLNYRTPDRLCDVWPTRFTTLERIRTLQNQASTAGVRERAALITKLEAEKKKASAEAYAGDPAKLANLVYAGRMGNTQPGDGYLFRGGGFAQITGRGMYQDYERHARFGNLEKLAAAVRTDDRWALDSAAWFFAVAKGLVPLAIADDFKEIVHRWNGGYVGMQERLAYYDRAVRYIN